MYRTEILWFDSENLLERRFELRQMSVTFRSAKLAAKAKRTRVSSSSKRAEVIVVISGCVQLSIGRDVGNDLPLIGIRRDGLTYAPVAFARSVSLDLNERTSRKRCGGILQSGVQHCTSQSSHPHSHICLAVKRRVSSVAHAVLAPPAGRKTRLTVVVISVDLELSQISVFQSNSRAPQRADVLTKKVAFDAGDVVSPLK